MNFFEVNFRIIDLFSMIYLDSWLV